MTAILLAIGVMDLRAMALVTAAITAERLAPAGERVPQATGNGCHGGRTVIHHASNRAWVTHRVDPKNCIEPCKLAQNRHCEIVAVDLK